MRARSMAIGARKLMAGCAYPLTEPEATGILEEVYYQRPVETIEDAVALALDEIARGLIYHPRWRKGAELGLEESLSVGSLAIDVRRDPPKYGFRSWHWRLVDPADESVVAESAADAFYQTRDDAIRRARVERQAMDEHAVDWTRVDG